MCVCVKIWEYQHDWTITSISILRTELDVFDLSAFPFSVANLMNQGLLKAVHCQVSLWTERNWVGFVFHTDASERRKDPTCLFVNVIRLRAACDNATLRNAVTYVQTKERRAVPWHRRCRFLWRPGFIPNPVHVGFIIEEVALGQIFFSDTSVFPSPCHSTIAPYCHITPTQCGSKSC